MTYQELKSLILEGAPSEKEAEIAEAAMQHYSYTSLSYRVTNMLAHSGMNEAQQEDLVIMFSLNFYTHDLERYKRTGTFEKK